jgi:hypothetical protein
MSANETTGHEPALSEEPDRIIQEYLQDLEKRLTPEQILALSLGVEWSKWEPVRSVVYSAGRFWVMANLRGGER